MYHIVIFSIVIIVIVISIILTAFFSARLRVKQEINEILDYYQNELKELIKIEEAKEIKARCLYLLRQLTSEIIDEKIPDDAESVEISEDNYKFNKTKLLLPKSYKLTSFIIILDALEGTIISISALERFVKIVKEKSSSIKENEK